MFKQDYRKLIKSRMSEIRYVHSLNVEKEAVRLARLYGADEEKAAIAAILHDITKETPPQEQLQMICCSGIILSDVEQSAQKLWHAISGAAFLKDTLHIEDKDILNAVRYHTTGRAEMSLLEKVVFVADFTGAERNYDGVDTMREKAKRSLEQAMLFGLSFSIADLVKRGLTIHPNTLDAYNQILIQSENNRSEKIDSI